MRKLLVNNVNGLKVREFSEWPIKQALLFTLCLDVMLVLGVGDNPKPQQWHLIVRVFLN